VKKEKVHEADYLSGANPDETDLFVAALSGASGSEMKAHLGRMIVDGGLWTLAIDLALYDDPRVAFRSAWALEWAYENDRKAFLPHAGQFLGSFVHSASPSVHRHYAKIIYDMLLRDVLTPSPAQAVMIAERSFDLLIDPAVKPAVKVWCMDMLFWLGRMPSAESLGLSWIKEQLHETLRLIMQNAPSKGIATRARKVLVRM